MLQLETKEHFVNWVDDYPHLIRPDVGCHLHPRCLECPREFCIEDVSEFQLEKWNRMGILAIKTKLDAIVVPVQPSISADR